MKNTLIILFVYLSFAIGVIAQPGPIPGAGGGSTGNATYATNSGSAAMANSATGLALANMTFFQNVISGTNQIDAAALYVDSVAGSDANPGTITAPFKTLAMVTNAVGKSIYGKAGSVFHEAFPLPDNSHIMAYGSGQKPTVTGAETLTNALFTLSSGLTNTYEYPWTNKAMMVWETKGIGNFSTRHPGGFGWSITNSGIVDGIAGSWFAGTNKLYVHLADNSNPASNSWIYEVAVRSFGIYSGSNTVCEDWIAEKQWVDANTQGYNILGHCKNTYKRCIGRYAFYHNIGVTDNANQYLNLEDCVGFECEPWAVR